MATITTTTMAETPPTKTAVEDVKIPGQTDFFRSNEDEPHCIRRKQILAKYPQIKKLFGYDPNLPIQVGAIALLQFALSIAVTVYQAPMWLFLATAYIIGGTCNHALMVAMHEFCHNMGFKSHTYNLYYAIFVVNTPLAIPYYVRFKRYHMDHHRYQGVEEYDVVLPTSFEGKLFNNTFTKFLYVLFHIVVYSIRPFFINPKKPVKEEFINFAVVLSLDAALVYFSGSFMPLYYLLLSTFFGGGLHPCAGNFIAEHYIFHTKKDGDNSKVPTYETETYSYYGPLNVLNFNIGYHNEHHDFPFVPGSRLPQVRAIAPEFYDNLPHHTSYIKVIWDYITDPNISAYSRVKRPTTSALTPGDDPYGVEPDTVQRVKK